MLPISNRAVGGYQLRGGGGERGLVLGSLKIITATLHCHQPEDHPWYSDQNREGIGRSKAFAEAQAYA